MTKVCECPSSQIVSDRFYDLLHSLIELFEDRLDKICLSGSFSLNAHGVLHRPISDIDMCIIADVFDDSIKRLREKIGKWFISDGSSDVNSHRFFLIEGDGAKLCVFRHDEFPDNLGLVMLHGQHIGLYPPLDIIRYKAMAFLSVGKPNPMSEKAVRKHVCDITSFTRLAKRQIGSQLITLLPTLVTQVNSYCKDIGYSTRYEITTSNDSHRNGLTWQIKSVSV